MAMTSNANSYYEKIFQGEAAGLAATDPEFAERFYNFAFDEVVYQADDHILLPHGTGRL